MTEELRAGRPPAGKRKGERVRDYPALTLRLPPDTRALLDAWSAGAALPVWRIVDSAVMAAFKALPESEQRRLRAEARRATQ